MQLETGALIGTVWQTQLGGKIKIVGSTVSHDLTHVNLLYEDLGESDITYSIPAKDFKTDDLKQITSKTVYIAIKEDLKEEIVIGVATTRELAQSIIKATDRESVNSFDYKISEFELLD